MIVLLLLHKKKLNKHNIVQIQQDEFKTFKENENQNNPFNAFKVIMVNITISCMTEL